MRTSLLCMLAVAVQVGSVDAQDPDRLLVLDFDPVRLQVGYVLDAYFDTPGGQGLLPTAVAEAEIALEHVRLAGRDSTYLGNMRANMVHVLHALDPYEVGSGFGLGYGVKRAANAVAMNIEVAAATEGASENVVLHSTSAARAARSAVLRADEAIALARAVQAASTARDANRLVERLAASVRAILYGSDSDGDGRIGWAEDEAGLAQVRYHLTLMMRVEDMPADTLIG